MTPSANNASGPGPDPARTRRREQLIATLEALIYNDDLDLGLFQPGVPWPQARNITQQPHTPFRVTPEEPSDFQSDYKDVPIFESAIGSTGEYSHIDSDLSYCLRAHQNDDTNKAISRVPHTPKTGFEGSDTTVSSHIAPPPPTPLSIRDQEHHRQSQCLTSSQFGQIITQEKDGYTNFDFSKPLTAPSTRSPREDTYTSIAKTSDLPLLDLMSWDTFMDYQIVPNSSTDDMDKDNSANGADDFCSGRKASDSALAMENEPPVQSPSESGSRVAKTSRRRRYRQGSKCSSSPPPASVTSDPTRATTEKGCQPKSYRAHSTIEKRYRAGINEKFEILRSCVESRKMPKQQALENGLSETSKDGDCGGGGAITTILDRKKGAGGPGEAATRMNKAEVLSEAAEYIQQLEDENSLMLDQLKILVQRLRATWMALQPVTPESTVLSGS